MNYLALCNIDFSSLNCFPIGCNIYKRKSDIHFSYRFFCKGACIVTPPVKSQLDKPTKKTFPVARPTRLSWMPLLGSPLLGVTTIWPSTQTSSLIDVSPRSTTMHLLTGKGLPRPKHAQTIHSKGTIIFLLC